MVKRSTRLRAVGDRHGMGDAELMVAIGAGDRIAFAELYDRYAVPCYTLARRIVIDEGLAEDAVQEAFLAVWRQAADYSAARGKAGTWLISLTHHKAVDAVRRQDSAHRRDARAEDLTGWLAHSGEQPTPDEQVWRNHRRDRVLAALTTLTGVQREVLVLAYFGGYSYPEITAMTGIPLGTVKTRAHSAVARLRLQLGDLE
ncbi:MAG TPA: sigma-70 family RNA polymerase sigma factor [Mycobacteriales bacterium]|jgi:RNA polymerase sigma-70 factor (ECF subfamily)|nr:sigma-70 family RNA polymerase sigma factor [Mycobacteriales bacterium]